MCGIVGVINTKGFHLPGAERVMRDMLLADQVRGMDGTGIFSVGGAKKNSLNWVKKPDNASNFLEDKDAKALLWKSESYCFLVGHNRAATTGGVTTEATQPIEEGPITLVHNGTLTYWPTKNKNGKHDLIHAHDTAGITWLLANQGIEAVAKECFGAMSLVWYDDRTGTLNFWRNKERPMCFYPTKDAIFFGSELGLLFWIGRRNSFYPEEKNMPYSIEPETLYTFEKRESKPRVKSVKESLYSSPNDSDWYKAHQSPIQTEAEKEVISRTLSNTVTNSPVSRLKMKEVDKYGSFVKGSMITFSLLDVEEPKNPKQRFRCITGKYLGDMHPEVVVTGNTAIEEKELFSNKFYLRGEVSNILRAKNGSKVLVLLKTITLTDIIDPAWTAQPPAQAPLTQVETKVAPTIIFTSLSDDIKRVCDSCKKEHNKAEMMAIEWRYKLNPTSKLQTKIGIFCKHCASSWDEDSQYLMPPDLKQRHIDLQGSKIYSVH